MSPASRSIQPTHGARNSDSLAIHFISRGSKDSTRMSSMDSWLATTTQCPGGSAPSTCTCHSGHTLTTSTAQRRNSRPTALRPGSKGAVTRRTSAIAGSHRMSASSTSA